MQMSHTKYAKEAAFIDSEIWQSELLLVVAEIHLRTAFLYYYFFFSGTTSSLVASNISISFMILLAISVLLADTILRDIRSNGPPKRETRVLFSKPRLRKCLVAAARQPAG